MLNIAGEMLPISNADIDALAKLAKIPAEHVAPFAVLCCSAITRRKTEQKRPSPYSPEAGIKQLKRVLRSAQRLVRDIEAVGDSTIQLVQLFDTRPPVFKMPGPGWADYRSRIDELVALVTTVQGALESVKGPAHRPSKAILEGPAARFAARGYGAAAIFGGKLTLNTIGNGKKHSYGTLPEFLRLLALQLPEEIRLGAAPPSVSVLLKIKQFIDRHPSVLRHLYA
jgi:hypothetical protein